MINFRNKLKEWISSSEEKTFNFIIGLLENNIIEKFSKLIGKGKPATSKAKKILNLLL